MKLTREEKASLVLAMEYMVRNINDEEIIDGWLRCGVPDGDIAYGETDVNMVDESYTDNDTFKEFVECFTRRLKFATERGGLCD